MSKKWLLILTLAAASAVAVPAYSYFCGPDCPVCSSGSCPIPCPR
jgi:hypothetical protein